MTDVPAAGDIVWLDFDPQVGGEQAGRRPALVLTTGRYNRLTGLMIVCPCTTRIKGYPYEVPLDGSPPSVALTDHAKSVDWQARRAQFKAQASPATLALAKATLQSLLVLP